MAGPPCEHVFTQAQHARFTRKAYNRQKVSRKAQKRVALMVRCQVSKKGSLNAKRLTRRLRGRYKERAAIRAVTPYNCPPHGRFAVPCYIVQCESQFRPYVIGFGIHVGYYQLRMEYLNGDHSVANQHRVAARLWNGGAGAGHWACA